MQVQGTGMTAIFLWEFYDATVSALTLDIRNLGLPLSRLVLRAEDFRAKVVLGISTPQYVAKRGRHLGWPKAGFLLTSCPFAGTRQ